MPTSDKPLSEPNMAQFMHLDENVSLSHDELTHVIKVKCLAFSLQQPLATSLTKTKFP